MIAKREKVVKQLEANLVYLQKAVASTVATEVLSRIEVLREQLTDVCELWNKASDLTDKIAATDPMVLDEVTKVQETLDLRLDVLYPELKRKITRLMTDSRAMREQTEMELSRTPPRVAASSPVGGSCHGGGSRVKLEKMPLPIFNGQIEEYAEFRKDWQDVIAKELDEAAQLRRIRTQIPVRDKKDIVGMSTMEQVWKYLNENYGKVGRIVAVTIKKLHKFKLSGKAKTDVDKFLELYTA